MSLSEGIRALFRLSWGDSLEALCDPTQASAFSEASAFRDISREVAVALAHESFGKGVSSSLSAELVRWLWLRHQFIELDLAAQAQLTRSIRRALRAAASGVALEAALGAHREELAAFVRARLGAHPRDVVSAEYSPALQLAVLGLSEDMLRPPLLDVGCGPEAALVRSLRLRGLDALGLDRTPPADVGCYGDWLTFDYGRRRWGTVLSHLGFSLYFLHHHLAGRAAAADFARAYMAILHSLAPGGSFIYTPGLPFIEQLLDAGEYRIRCVEFAPELRVQTLTDIEQRTGLALSHATHVERLK